MLAGKDGKMSKGETIEDVMNHAKDLWIYPEGYKDSLGILKMRLTCSCLHFSKISLA